MLALAAPPLPRTTDLYGMDRAVVRLGTFLADLGHRRAAARAQDLELGGAHRPPPSSRSAPDAGRTSSSAATTAHS
jgi:hypothetical protein